MENFKDINSAIEKLKGINDQLKQLDSTKFKTVDFSKETKELKDKGEELKEYVSLIKRWLEVKIFSKNDSLFISKGYLVYEGKRPENMEFTHEDFLEIIEEGQELLESLTDEFVKKPFLPDGKKVIFNFMYVYNTLVEISLSFNDLIKKRIASLENESNGYVKEEKERIRKEKEKLTKQLNEIKDYIVKKCGSNSNNNSSIGVEFGNGYNDKVFLGYGLSKSINDDTAKLAKDLLGIDLSEYASKTPVYYELNKNMSPILINCKPSELKNRDYLSFLEDLSLYFITALPAKKVRFAGIECESTGLVQDVFDGVAELFYDERTKSNVHEIIYSVGEDSIAEKPYDIKELLTDLNNLIKSRRRKYATFSRKFYDNTNSHSNFFDYNNRITDNQDELIVLFVNNYPKGFEDKETQNLFQYVLDAKMFGIVTIILQDTSKELYEKGDSYSTVEYEKLPYGNASYNIISDVDDVNGIITYNGKHLSFEENEYNLSHSELMKEIAEKVKSLASFSTMDLINKVDGSKYSSLDKALRIPLGLGDSGVFNFVTSISGSPHSIILGGTGAGKTALLHTLILNACATYSPDELEFYLCDFKSTQGSGAFGSFLKGKDMYIPHIKYLCLKASGDNTKDMLSMIKSIHNERMELIGKCGLEDIVSYNNSKQVKSGNPEFPRLTRLCFIIDEYAEMLEGAGKNQNTLKELSRLLKLVRTSGIFIILCGQSDGALSDDELKQIDNRILLKGYQVSNTREYIGSNEVVQDIRSFATVAGRGCVAQTVGGNFSNVNFAFSGGVGSDLINSICKYIRNKYKAFETDQIVAGDESLVDIETDKRVPGLIEKNFSNGYHLYVGQSAISYAPVAVRYFTTQKDSNYILTGEKEMIDRVKQNVILSFLHNTFLAGKKYNGPCVYDCWFKVGQETGGDCLADYKKQYPFLSKHVKHMEDKYEMAETIMDIYKKYEDDKITEPILLVVHGGSSISSVGEYAYEQTEEKRQLDIEAMVDAKVEELKNMAAAQGQPCPPDEQLRMYVRQGIESTLAQTEVRHDNISCQLVRDSLKVLHRYGHLHNIFILLAEGTYEYIEPFIKGNEKVVYSSVCDRVDIKEEANVTQYPTSCSHVKSNQYTVVENEGNGGKITRSLTREEVDMKVKLYDYSIETNQTWWEEFSKLANK